MYHRVRRKMKFEISAILILSYVSLVFSKAFDIKRINDNISEDIENDIIDFDDDYSVKYDKKHKVLPWDSNDHKKDSYRYTVVKEKVYNGFENEDIKPNTAEEVSSPTSVFTVTEALEKTTELSVIPLELISTTEINSVSPAESTTEFDLTVIPLRSSEKAPVELFINQTVTIPVSTESSEDYNLTTFFYEMTTKSNNYLNETTTENIINETSTEKNVINENVKSTSTKLNANKTIEIISMNHSISNITESVTILPDINKATENRTENITENFPSTTTPREDINTTSSKTNETINREDFESTEVIAEVPIFTELDTEDISQVPEDYYDSKDVVSTSAPKTDALSVIFGFAGSVVESVVESVAERVVPKGLIDLFRRMQRQNEALEAEKLRSREENGGIGQFTRGVIKTISSGLSKPLSQLMAGARDIGSLDSDRGFVNSLASGVTSVANVANSMVDLFKDRVQAIYPGTIWCGDGHSAQARSGDLGLFFFTDTCCRQHDACKLYIGAGDTKFGLTNTGLFTRSHCSCDENFRQCLRKTNSLVSAQIGLTYFNVLGPQCFRRAHPIVKCLRRTRITGLKCEEYELDYTKPKMWQWFDNETF
ncbi:uncharacterized protein LOC120626194 [Pararge aegeria]|uniref:uncharacterized protein LOC120626194 n=1 Tax=Pararge aegeria TaxID=116150 RepID=UPI0019D07B29|nr:uncharacterized protein LOC120626194 [Pararge aegeria]